LLSAAPLLPNDTLIDRLTAVGEVDVRQVTLAEAGLLTITADDLSAGLDTRLSLARADGALLIQSEGRTPADRTDRIEQHLAAGTYLVRIESTTAQTGEYQLTTTFAAVSPPFQQIPLGTNPVTVILGDFDGDGVLDMATANTGSNDVSILRGVGDGTFYAQQFRYAVEVAPTALAVGDFNGDGELDLVVTSSAGADNVRVLLGTGDGTFAVQPPQTFGANITAAAVGDFDGDSKLDLAVTHGTTNTVSILLGSGSGTFASVASLPVGTAPKSTAVGDFNGDGILDLVTANNHTAARSLSLLLGNGDGTFAAAVSIGVGEIPMTVVVGDFDNDGDLDLACTNQLAFNVSIFLNDGAGNFSGGTHFAAGRRPTTMQTGDFNGDGVLDLAVANTFSNDVSILLGQGDGTFQTQQLYNPGLILVGQLPQALAIGDLNGDGQLDLVTANSTLAVNPPHSVSVLLGRGDGSFQENRGFAAGDAPAPLAVADFNGDGRLDVIVPNVGSNDISVLLGLADGTFQSQQRFTVGDTPSSAVVGDFNGDGRLDLAVPNSGTTSRSISILLGIGDGTFQADRQTAAGFSPWGLISGDFNQDGHLDLAAVNRATAAQGGDNLSIFFGRGDGSFELRAPYAVGVSPQAVTTADLNGDGVLDLIVASSGPRHPAEAGPGSLTIFLGHLDKAAPNGYWLEALPHLTTGIGTGSLLIADVNGDGLLDVVAANKGPGVSQAGPLSNTISLFLGHRDAENVWSLLPEEQYTVVGAPTQLVVADVNADGRPDLFVGSAGGAGSTNEISILLGVDPAPGSHRPFAAELRLDVPGPVVAPVSIVLKDFNRDGTLDIAFTSQNVPSVAILLGNGDGTFAPFQTYALNAGPTGMTVADFNGDGFHDIVTSNKFADDVTVLLGLGDGTFVPSITSPNPIRSVPILVDVNRDGTSDLVVLNNNGQILYRAGRSGEPGVYAPPLLVNPGVAAAARDLTVLRQGNTVILAALDTRGGGISFYSLVAATGTFQRTTGPTVHGSLPARILAGDLNRDGRDDLIVAVAGSGTVHVYLRPAVGAFGPAPDAVITVGTNPTTLQLVDVDQNGWLDIVTANQFSGDVSVVHNGPGGLAAGDRRYRAGVGLYGLELFDGAAAIRSLEGTVGLAAGDFNGDGIIDLLAANNGANQLALLLGNGQGGVLNPAASLLVATGSFPTLVVTGDFNGDDRLDLAVLGDGEDELEIFLGDGQGGFVRSFAVAAGNVPTGLTLADINGDGQLDLLVGNQFGDVLVLAGNGDGTFEPYRRTGRSIALAVADLDGDGIRDFVLANESFDRVVVQYGQAGVNASWQTITGLLGPDAVDTADLNGDGILDLVVANGGGNDLLVYLGRGNGQFDAARTFFTGTNPSGFTIADLDGNGWLDVVVANQGSNDVSVLLGQGTRDAAGAVTSWGLTYGPRLNAGYDPVTGAQVGLGPVATAVADITGNGVLDVLVANHATNNVVLLAGIGNGFFNDQQPSVFAVGVNPRQVLVGNFDGLPGVDFLTINTGSNSISYFSGAAGGGVQIGTGGLSPGRALAGDFNGDGLSDLMVAHNGDGLFALLVGSPTGPEIAGGLHFADLQRPTDLALAALHNGILELFAVDEGREVIFFLTFDFRPSPVSAELLPLRDADLAVVATLVAGSAEDGPGSLDENAGAAAVPAFQAFVVGLDDYPAEPDGATGGDDERLDLFAVPIAVLDQLFRDLIQPVGAEFVQGWAALLGGSLPALADLAGPFSEQAARTGDYWENMLRALFPGVQPAAAPLPDAAAEPLPEAGPCGAAPADGTASAVAGTGWAILRDGLTAPPVIVTEIAACMLGVWVLERRERWTALPGKVRRPQE